MKILRKLMVVIATSLFVFATAQASLIDPNSELGMTMVAEQDAVQAQPQRMEIHLPELPELDGIEPVTMEEAQAIAMGSVTEIINMMAIIDVDANQNAQVLVNGAQVAQMAASFPETREILQNILDRVAVIVISKENLATFLPYMRSAGGYHPSTGYAVQKKFFKSHGVQGVPPYTDEEVELMADPQFLDIYRLYVAYMEAGAITTGQRIRGEVLPMISRLHDALSDIVIGIQQSSENRVDSAQNFYASASTTTVTDSAASTSLKEAYDDVYHTALAYHLPLLEGVVPDDRERGEELIETAAREIAQIVTSEEVYPYYLAMKQAVAVHPEWEEQATLVATMTKYGSNMSLLPEGEELMGNFEFQQMVVVMRNWQRAFDPHAFPILAGLRLDLNRLRYEES